MTAPADDFDSMITCSICLERMVKPKMLPCVHTFCLKCLQDHCKTTAHRQEACCPLCRKKFKVPPNGLTDLQTNIFLQQLIDMNSNPKGEVCGICSASRRNTSSPASKYCEECCIRMCDQCASQHASTDGMEHRIVSANEPTSRRCGLSRSRPCKKHSDRIMELHCVTCKCSICFKCFYEAHREHESRDINEYANTLKVVIDSKRQAFSENIKKMAAESERLRAKREETNSNFDTLQQEIERRYVEITRLSKSQQKDIVENLRAEKSNTLHQLDTLENNICSVRTSMERFNDSAKSLISKDSPIDAILGYQKLATQAQDVMQTYAQLDFGKCRIPDMEFTPAVLWNVSPPKGKTVQLVGVLAGKLTMFGRFRRSFITPEMAVIVMLFGLLYCGILPVSQQVCQPTKCIEGETLKLVGWREQSGFAISDRRPTGSVRLNDELYVVYNNSDTVEVFSSERPHRIVHRVHVTGMRSPSDIAACSDTNTLYIADWMAGCIWKFHAGSNTIDMIVTHGYRPWTLSVKSSRLLVTPAGCHNDLHVYGSFGDHLKSVRLPSYMNPQHAVETKRGRYLVAHIGRESAFHDQVSNVDDTGRVVHVYGGPRSDGPRLLNMPYRLTADDNGRVIVADMAPGRNGVVLGSGLQYRRTVPADSRDEEFFVWRVLT